MRLPNRFLRLRFLVIPDNLIIMRPTVNSRQPPGFQYGHANGWAQPAGERSSQESRVRNLIHRPILSDEMHVSNLESLSGKFGISTAAATTPGPLKAILLCLYVREVDVTPQGLGVVLPGNFGRWPLLKTEDNGAGMPLLCGIILKTMCLSERMARAWVLTLPISLWTTISTYYHLH